MKKIIISIACIIIVGLSVATIYYQKLPPLTLADTYPILRGHPDHDTTQNQTQNEPKKIQPIYEQDNIGYAFQDHELYITFDNGSKWSTVPVEIDKLFGGEYNGAKDKLIDGSFVLSNHNTSFIYLDGASHDNRQLAVVYTKDKGQTWQHVKLADVPSLRFRKIAFLNHSFGYMIVSTDRTMSAEATSVFLTYDGGENWQVTNQADTVTLISDGAFLDEQVGFLSFSRINPEEPELYVTQDSGETWTFATFHIPETYDKVFTTAEVPQKDYNHLTVLVNQGPNGDYKGGQVKGAFISNDNGETWEFAKEVEPDETIE